MKISHRDRKAHEIKAAEEMRKKKDVIKGASIYGHATPDTTQTTPTRHACMLACVLVVYSIQRRQKRRLSCRNNKIID